MSVNCVFVFINGASWSRGIVVITAAQFHSKKPELRFCADSSPVRGVSEIRDGENLWQWSRLEIRLNAFRRSPYHKKQFVIWCERIERNRIHFLAGEKQFTSGTIFLRCSFPGRGGGSGGHGTILLISNFRHIAIDKYSPVPNYRGFKE